MNEVRGGLVSEYSRFCIEVVWKEWCVPMAPARAPAVKRTSGSGKRATAATGFLMRRLKKLVLASTSEWVVCSRLMRVL